MAKATTTQWSQSSATVTGVAWLVLGLASIATPDPSHFLDLLMQAPLLASIAGFVGLYRFHRRATGRLARFGVGSAVVGLVLLSAGHVGMYLESAPIKVAFLPPGFALWIAGSVAVGIAMIRSGLLPRRYGLLVIFAEPLTVLTGVLLSPISPLASWGDYSGAVCQGVIWLSLARAIRSTREAGSRETAIARHNVPMAVD